MGDERGGPAVCGGAKVRITWERDRVNCLVGINERLDPLLKGRAREEALLQEWTALQPTLPSTGSTLAAKLRRVLQGRQSLPPPNPGVDSSPAPGLQEPARTRVGENPPIEPVSSGE